MRLLEAKETNGQSIIINLDKVNHIRSNGNHASVTTDCGIIILDCTYEELFNAIKDERITV